MDGGKWPSFWAGLGLTRGVGCARTARPVSMAVSFPLAMFSGPSAVGTGQRRPSRLGSRPTGTRVQRRIEEAEVQTGGGTMMVKQEAD